MSEIHIRGLQPTDIEQADAITRAAFEAEFGSITETDLVGKLRLHEAGAFELIAERHGEIVGHIILSPVRVTDEQGDSDHELMMGLGPMSVRPDLQRRGIGTDLIHAALCEAWDRGALAVVVLGHPTYYPRFGFETAASFGLSLPYKVPDDAFMVISRSGVDLPPGTVHYAEAFGTFS
jgi:putative acetyltransferase